ncbi:MAG: hypothetical protein ACXADB_07875 [Candidatus Hermodarchaeia archaeon]|jgi:hypothetical protein
MKTVPIKRRTIFGVGKTEATEQMIKHILRVVMDAIYWRICELGADREGPPDDIDLYRKVYEMEFWVESRLGNPVRRAVFWPLTNFLTILLKEEFGDSD